MSYEQEYTNYEARKGFVSERLLDSSLPVRHCMLFSFVKYLNEWLGLVVKFLTTAVSVSNLEGV
jgi:hypothetical protein